MNFSKLFRAVVINSMQSGFRRAGHRLENGENTIEVDESQIPLIENDPNLVLKETTEVLVDVGMQIAADKLGVDTNDLKTTVATTFAILGLGGKEIVLDSSGLAEELQPFAAVLAEMEGLETLETRPNCKDMAFEVDGKPVTPSKEQADAVWQWYQEQLANQQDAE